MLGVFSRPALPAMVALALLLHALLLLGLPWSRLVRPPAVPAAQRSAQAGIAMTLVVPTTPVPGPIPGPAPPRPVSLPAAPPAAPAAPAVRPSLPPSLPPLGTPSSAIEPVASTEPHPRSETAEPVPATHATHAAHAAPSAEGAPHLPRRWVAGLQPFHAQGQLTRAGREVPVALAWDASATAAGGGNTYRARVRSLDSAVGTPHIDWSSQGQWGPQGAIPERFLSTGRRGAAQAVNFQRDRQRIGFSGPTIERPWVEGAQDRLSLWMQMQAELAAVGPEAAVGGPWVFWVVGIQGDARAWSFAPQWVSPKGGPSGGAIGGAEPAGARPLLRMVHHAAARYDLEMELDWAWTPEPRLVAARWWHRGVAEARWELTLFAEAP